MTLVYADEGEGGCEDVDEQTRHVYHQILQSAGEDLPKLNGAISSQCVASVPLCPNLCVQNSLIF